MKKLAVLLSTAMAINAFAVPVFAGEESDIQYSASDFYYVEANGEQIRLSNKRKEGFLKTDNLYFRDLDKDGELDIYEDWSLDRKSEGSAWPV